MNAPGAAPGNRKSVVHAGISFISKTAPQVRNSRIIPSIVKVKVNPNPIPKPSSTERNGEFFEANASALPSTMQLTTISGINIPKAS